MRKTHYGRIVYVEPNDIAGSTGESAPLDNVTWNPEELNMAVDLQVIVPRRSDFGSRNLNTGAKNTIEIWHEGMDDIGRYISFMQGADIKDKNGKSVGHELTTDYINASYTEVTSQGQSCKEALGIDSIDITFDQHFYPQVNIKFIDVRGYSLMMPTEEVYRLEHVDAGSSRLSSGGYINFFRALFHFPYPRFLLTVKGFYGSSITFQLAVNEFRNNFNSDTGNFEITVSFIGYMYGLYTDIPLNVLIAAPYCAEQNGSTEAKKSNLWKDISALSYDDGKGNPNGENIHTFIEFLDACNNLNDAIAKQKGNTPQYTNLAKAQQNSAKITALEGIRTKLRDFVRQVQKDNQREAGYISTSDGYDAIWFKLNEGDEEKNGVKIDGALEQWNNFATAWNDYNKENKLDTPEWKPYGFMGENGAYLNRIESEIPNGIYNNGVYKGQKYYDPFYLEKETDGNGNVTFKRNPNSQGGVTIEFLKENYEDLQLKIYNSKYATNPVYYIMGSTVVKLIDSEINKLREEQKEIEPVAKEELEQFYKDNLKFNPSVLNIYRMLFAHIDCFMQRFYNVILEISNDTEGRKLENFGVSKDRMDMSPYMSGSALVPPFPAIFKEEDGRRVQIYPTEDLWDKMPEVKFVEDLISGIFGLKDKARRIISEQKDKVRFNQENEMAANNANYNYTPTAVSDFTRPEHPYSTVSPGDVNHIMECIMDRIISAYVQQYQSKDQMFGIGKIEADNFINLHKDTLTGTFKKELASIADADPVDTIKSFVNYWNTQNKAYQITFDNGKLKLKNKNLPVYSESYPSRKSNSILVSNNGYIQLNGKEGKTYEKVVESTTRYKDFTNFIESAENIHGHDDYKKIFTNGHSTKEELEWGSNWVPKRLNNETQRTSITSAEKISDIINLEGATFEDKRNGNFIFSFHGLTNEKGDAFIEKNGQTITSIDKAGMFLIHLSSEVYPFQEQYMTMPSMSTPQYATPYSVAAKSHADVVVPSLGNSCACVISYLSVCLMGYAFKKGITSTTITKTGSSELEITVGTNRPKTIYESIYNNEDLRNKIIGIFDDFHNNGSWKYIYNLLKNKDNYTQDGDVYKMSPKIKEAIYENIVSSNNNIVIYVLNNEVPNSVKEIEIDSKEFTDAVQALGTAYSLATTEYERTDPHFAKEDITDDFRLALYNSLKNLNDKWANSYEAKNFILRSPEEDKRIKAQRYEHRSKPDSEWCEFDNFIFVDCFYNDISNKFRMNPGILSDIICKHVQAESNYSIYECMSELMQKNRMLLQALPVHSNFYDFDTIQDIFTPNIKDSMVSGFGSTYIGMYTYEVSHVVEDERFDDHLDGDYFMIADLNGITDDPSPNRIGASVFALPQEDSGCLSIPVPAFGVTYARQNQSYFKRIDVNMDNPRVTDYSIFNMFALTNSINENELNRPLTVANDIYSIYANRSYNCSVEMMGCANIMPMMYFQLNNIPMFRGAYMISNVEHHISAGDFTTKFSGVRISKNQLPYNQELFNCNNAFDPSTSYGLTEPPVSYDEGYGESNVKVSFPSCENCVGWDVNAALAMMEVPKDYGLATKRGGSGCKGIPNQDYERLKQPDKGGFAPATNTSSHSCCASAVKTFIRAGYLAVANDASRPEEERSWARKRSGAEYCRTIAGANNVHGQLFHTESAEVNMAKNGFKHIYTTVSTTQAGVDKELKEFTYGGVKGVQPGDICTMLHAGSLSGGHIHMYRGSQYPRPWVSDYCDDNAYVYGNSVKKGDVWIYRFVGSKDLNNIESTKKNNAMQGGLPKGDIYRPERGKQPYEPYRIFNISRNAAAAKRLPINLSKITSYDSLPDKYKKGDAGTENQKSTTHRDAQGACNLFVYYVKDRYLDKGIKTLQEYIYTYVASYAKKQYLADAILYFSNRFKKNFTPQSEIVWTKEFICALGEFQAMREQGVNVTGTLMTTAWDNIQNYLNGR